MRKLTFALILVTVLCFLHSEMIEIGEGITELRLVEGTAGNTLLEYGGAEFERVALEIEGETWNQLYLEGESVWREAGYPGLPRLNRSVIIPETGAVKISVLESEYVEMELAVAPSKGRLSREINPDEVPYSFGEVYQADSWFPERLGELGEPYIFRDYRGVNLSINPFSYNGKQNKLRVYTHLVFRIESVEERGINEKTGLTGKISREFSELYSRHFINYAPGRYETITEEAGRMIVISYGDFIDEMEPFVEWKNQKGIATTIVDVASIGNNSTSIQNFIDSEYEADDGLVWVLLVGDGDEVSTKSYSGAGGDPQYSYLEGNDNYSEIFIGRFSAESASEVSTQVERSIYYERDIDETSGNWMQKGTGIASSQGSGQGHYGEADYVHIGYIRDDLLAYDYLEVDEIYDTNGGNASDVSNAINEGRGIINYCGHGSNYSWSSTGFNVSYVNALTNDYKLPFIQAVACVNGNFTGRTCFAEAWLRATNGTAPTGAIAMFASSINQSWAPPMYAQDESVDLMCAEELNTIGGLWFNGVSYMLDESNDTSMAKTWHIFGDPSLQVRSKVAEVMTASYDAVIMLGQETYSVNFGFTGGLASLSYEGEVLAEAYSGSDGSAYLFLGEMPDSPTTLTLTLTGYNKATEIDDIQYIIGTGGYLQMLGYNLESGDDGDLYAGEYGSLGLTLMNTGNAAVEDVEISISSSSEYITFSDAVENVAQVGIDQMITLEDCFSFTISEAALNGESVIFNLEAVTEETSWNYTIGEMLYAEPGMICDEELIMMSMDPDETGEMELGLKNNNFSGEISYTIMIDETTGDRSIAGSTLGVDALSFMPGETVDWTFSCENNSVDWEWIKDIQISFPVGVIVNTTTGFTGGSNELEFVGETGNGATCTWHGESSSGWGYLQNGDSASAIVNVTILPGYLGDIELSWQLTGDDYGSEPHIIDGEINLSGSALPISWLSVDTPEGELLPGEEAVHMLNFDSSGLESGLYTANVIIVNSEDDLVIPIELYVDMGVINYGDVDNNGIVESFDSSIVLQYIVGLSPELAPIPWEDWRIESADVDGNGAVESYDSALILQYVVEIIDEFPAETGREHIAPYGECDVRKVEGEETWLEFYTRGEVYSLDVMCRSHEFVLGEPEISSEALSAYNNNSNIYRYAVISSESLNRETHCLRIPVRGYEKSGNLEIYLKVNGYEYNEEIYLGETNAVVPVSSKLLGNYPNPFNPETRIEYSLNEPGQVQLEIYNIRGQLVKRLVDSTQNTGYHQVNWQGDNESGELCGSGTYFYLLRTESGNESKKMILLK